MKELSASPLVSVIIPTYNYALYIREAIESVLHSNFPKSEIEIIVVDDGSQDSTDQVMQEYLKNPNILYIKQENLGKAAATRMGILRARGEYLFNLDADDYFLPDKLQKVVRIFEAHSDVAHVGHPAICLNEVNRSKTCEMIPGFMRDVKQPGDFILAYFYKHRVQFGGGSTFCVRRSVLAGVEIPASVDMMIDEYLILKTLPNRTTYFISEPLSVWRIHGENFLVRAKRNNLSNLERNHKASKAVFQELCNYEFNPQIKLLYLLKLKSDELAIKEFYKTKTIKDAFILWNLFWRALCFLQMDAFLTIRKYNLINRSMPNFMINILKRVKPLVKRA